MALFRFRMEDPDNPDRVIRGTCEFDSAEEATAELERRQEERAVPYQAENIDELEAAEEERGWENLSGREKGAILLHRQDKPFKVVEMEEVE
jgi:hypothetical protein